MKFDLKKFAKIIVQVAPVALTAAGVPPIVTGQLTHLMVLAQSKPGKSGAEKKAFVLDALKTSLSATDELLHPGVTDLNVDEIVSAASNGIDATIQMIDTVHNIPVKAVPGPSL